MRKQTENENQDQVSVQMSQGPMIVEKSQGIREMCRDVIGCVFVMVSSALVTLIDDQEIKKNIDPIFAILSALCLFALSYSYSKN